MRYEPPDKCFCCDNGYYKEHIENVEFEKQNEKTFVVEDVPVLRCDICGDEIFPPESSRKIESNIYSKEQNCRF